MVKIGICKHCKSVLSIAEINKGSECFDCKRKAKKLEFCEIEYYDFCRERNSSDEYRMHLSRK